MGKLQAALDWAARGFPVFPLEINGKTPAYGDDWSNVATLDRASIISMWTDPVLRTEIDYNIGVKCNDMVVVDVDIKNGKDGLNQYAHLGGTYDTLVVRTASGGYHCYFVGPDSGNSPIAPDVDIRSHNGYVVGPGSTVDGVAYTVVNDVQPAFIPFAVERLLTAPKERKQQGVSEYIDSAASVEAGIRYLTSAPPAIEGQRGDEVTFITAARLCRELALSPDTAYLLMLEHFNPRCVPPWDADELYGKVLNAAAYGTAEMGRLDPSVMFATVNIEPPPTVFVQGALGFGNASLPSSIPPRPWIVERLLMRGETTLLIAPGSAGKSSLSLAIAAHLALGLNFGPYKTRVKCKTIVYNGEDDIAEQSRRLYAVCDMYRIDYNEVKSSIMLLSADDVDFKFVAAAGYNTVVNETLISQLVGFASSEDVGCIVYDPLIDVHDVDESDNPRMNLVMRTIRRIAKEAGVASLVLHHTQKGGSSRQEDRVGNAEISRGASGIVNKARIAFTLMNASSQDCEDFGIQESERTAWVRLDDAKMNLTMASANATWFKKREVKLPSGDLVGVLYLTEMKKDSTHIRTLIGDVLIGNMIANGTATMTLSQAVAVIKQELPLYANKTDTEIRHRIEGMFSTRVDIRGRHIQARREGDGVRSTIIIVLG